MEEMAALADLLWMLVTDRGTGALLLLLAAAAVVDWRTLRIPNWLTVPGMLYGLLYNATSDTSIGSGLAFAAGGLAVGMGILLPLYLMRVLGAGDVKLAGAIGAFLGAAATLKALLIVFIVGGIAALLYAAVRGALGRLSQNLRFVVTALVLPTPGAFRSGVLGGAPSVGKLAYGVSIAVGTAVFLVARQLGFL